MKFQRDEGGRNPELGFQKKLDKLNQNRRTQNNFNKRVCKKNRLSQRKPCSRWCRRDDRMSGESAVGLNGATTVCSVSCVLCVHIYVLIL